MPPLVPSRFHLGIRRSIERGLGWVHANDTRRNVQMRHAGATRSSSLYTMGFSVPRVSLALWHDQRYVWFVPKVSPSKHWVAKILVEVLVAHDLADIVKKNELELARVHWHAKKSQPSKQRPIFGS